MARFELIAGKHGDKKRNYVKGDIVQSASDLVKVFPGKFRKLDDSTATTPTASEKAKAQEATKAPVEEKTAASVLTLAARGKDVTEKFPVLAEEGFKVFFRDKLYHVYEGDKTTPIKGGEGLEKDKIGGAVTAYLEN